jgi:predicted transcriptional regulator
LIITIENNKLSVEEKRLIKLKKIAENFSKPEGTIRFVILNEIGYVEEFNNKKWEFKGELTKKEIKKLRKK